MKIPENTAGRINSLVADRLREGADLLEQQGANHFRVLAYRRAAESIAAEKVDLSEMISRKGVGIGRAQGQMTVPITSTIVLVKKGVGHVFVNF